MRNSDVVRLSFQNLWRTRFRSFLTILGVTIGISAILLFVSLGVGLQKTVTEQLTAFSALTTLTVSQTPASTSMEEGQAMTNDTVAKFRNIDAVEEVSPSISLAATIKNGESSAGAIVTGVLIENANMETSGLLYGTGIKAKGEAVISSVLAAAFSNDKEKLLGQKIKISIIENTDGLDFRTRESEATVVGVDNNNTTNSVITDMDSIKPAGEYDKYTSVKVKTLSRKDINSVKDEIKKQGFQVTTINDLLDQIDKIFLLAQIILGLVGGIGLAVSSLGIINTMTISFLERTREIGIMKAIGASDKDIKRLFLFESALIGFMGGAAGVLTAYIFGYCINVILNYIIKNSGQHLLLFITPPAFAAAMLVLAMIISVLAGLYPTHRAQKLQPIDAIRQ